MPCHNNVFAKLLKSLLRFCLQRKLFRLPCCNECVALHFILSRKAHNVNVLQNNNAKERLQNNAKRNDGSEIIRNGKNEATKTKALQQFFKRRNKRVYLPPQNVFLLRNDPVVGEKQRFRSFVSVEPCRLCSFR